MFKKILIFNTLSMLITFSAFAEDYYDEYEKDDEEKIAVSAFIEYNVPTGDFGNFWGDGFGIHAHLEYFISNNTAIGLRSGYVSWKPDPDIKLSEGGIDYEYEFTSVPIVANARYNFINEKNFSLYAGFIMGAYLTKEIRRIFEWRNNNRVKTQEYIESANHLNIAPNIGVLILFGSLYININAAYNILFYPAYNRTFLSFYGGITLPLHI